MVRKNYLYLLTRYTLVYLAIFPIFVQAQDPSFSQFYANRIYLNPAFAGIEQGVAVTGVSRVQWHQADQGFRTFGVAIEGQLPVVRLGIGLQVIRDVAGVANLTTDQVGLVLSYTIPGDQNNLHVGFEGRLLQKTLNWDKLVFSDQLDPVYGIIYPTNIVPILDRVLFGDFSFGLVWRNQSKMPFLNKGYGEVRSHLGISLHHLPNLFTQSAQGNDSFLSQDVRIAPRVTFHGGMIIPVRFFQGTGFEIALSPNFKLDMQGYRPLDISTNITVGTAGMYALINQFYLGFLYQNRFYAPNSFHTDAFILSIGGYANSWRKNASSAPQLFFGVSIDFNSTGVGPEAGSVFELNFKYRFNPKVSGDSKRGRSGNRRVLDCKNFF